MGSTLSKLQARLAAHGQEHLLRFWDVLSDDEQDALGASLDGIDFDEIAELLDGGGLQTDWSKIAARARQPQAVRLDGSGHAQTNAEALIRGIAAISVGEVGVLLVAGGQGTRLGFDHPKGMYPIAPDSGRTLFQILIEKLLDQANRHGASIPLYLMTSPATHDETVDLERALRIIEEAIRLSKRSLPQYYESRGRILMRMKRYSEAIPDLERGIRDRSLAKQCHQDLATCYKEINDPEMAEEHQQASLEFEKQRFATSALKLEETVFRTSLRL